MVQGFAIASMQSCYSVLYSIRLDLRMIPHEEVSEMERNDTATIERPMGSIKHPLVAFGLASARIVFHAFRHGPKPARVDYGTGDVWLDREKSS